LGDLAKKFEIYDFKKMSFINGCRTKNRSIGSILEMRYGARGKQVGEDCFFE